jgi:hypothetical protein
MDALLPATNCKSSLFDCLKSVTQVHIGSVMKYFAAGSEVQKQPDRTTAN